MKDEKDVGLPAWCEKLEGEKNVSLYSFTF